MDRKKMIRLAVVGTAATALAIGGVVWWVGKQRFEATDNAFVQADTVAVGPQVPGYVGEVLVGDNDVVRPGQVLVRLDPAEAAAQVAEAEANLKALNAAAANVDARRALEEAQVAERASAVASAEAQARLARAELDRYGRLAQSGWVSPQRVQTISATADQSAAGVAQARASLEAQRRDAAALSSVKSQTLAQAEQARAALEQAKINLDRTVIRAPAGGVVGARAVRTGQYVRPGQQLLSIVPLGKTYVVANFKETQVGRLRVGQTVEIKADAFKGQTFKGRVASFAPATGSQFALIPIENASGNFTKITQRLPVRIEVERGTALAAALRPGLSVEVKVDVTSKGGESFADAAAAAAQNAYADASR